MGNNSRMRKTMALLSAVCMIGTAGCGSGAASAAGMAEETTNGLAAEETADTQAADDAEESGNVENAGDVENAGNMKSAGDVEGAGDAGTKTGQDAADMEKPQEAAGNSEGKWHVLDAETAAAVDADFQGMVWKIEESSFLIVEEERESLEDGSIASSVPAPGADIPDSDLIPVVFSEDTYFYIRTIYENGARYEDKEAGFSDLNTDMTVDLKGRFENDTFYADEIRILKVS